MFDVLPFAAGEFAAASLPLLPIALVLDAYLGGMGPLFRRVPHPVVLVGHAVDWFDAKLNRPNRGTYDRRLRGLLTVVLLCAAAWAAGAGVSWISANVLYGWALELFLLVTLLAQRELFDRVRAVGLALRDEGLDAGRREVAQIVGRDPLRLDAHGVARAAVESLAENFSDGVVAPVFWYLLFGPPGLFVYKTVNTLDSMVGHRTQRHEAFGMAAARFDDLLNFVPARLSSLLLALAAVATPTAAPFRALGVAVRDAGKHRSVNAGWPEAALAGALGLALAGPRHYRERTVSDPWINEKGKARVTPMDIRRALYLFVIACLINLLAVTGLWVVVQTSI